MPSTSHNPAPMVADVELPRRGNLTVAPPEAVRGNEAADAKDVGPYDLFMLGLCIAAIASLAVETISNLPPEAARVLGYADFVVCMVFLLDFAITFVRSENRVRYFLTWGWIDLASSIPTVGFLKLGRATRIFRILRLIRALRSARVLSQAILDQRQQSALLAAAFGTLLIVTLASIGILHLDDVPGATIRTAGDALWWSVVTITTVGYGDTFPLTPEGRALGVMLMVSGVGLMGTFTALIAAWFLRAEGTDAAKLDEIHYELRELKSLLQNRDGQPDRWREHEPVLVVADERQAR